MQGMPHGEGIEGCAAPFKPEGLLWRGGCGSMTRLARQLLACHGVAACFLLAFLLVFNPRGYLARVDVDVGQRTMARGVAGF
jgi:organic hydroperoxide reductase OsmC/OhrA